ncbi:hypothetical protein CY34DRAFT_811992 [Suillus luteus UH-Slu-Lm8-n1]|uniref:Uncharacterized protein n=1 Tax=Suillus luteus UH-Slu-Lm8-n1 TaxID=930992 RepID=A0A0D0AN34_9AGAM|nr:hypothetical protein CY34DRAFT_811992 [Suillus luteus UH-Slu-Lm8-n1]
MYQTKAVANIIQERRLLEGIDHPFVGSNCLAMSSCSWTLSSRSLTTARDVLEGPATNHLWHVLNHKDSGWT